MGIVRYTREQLANMRMTPEEWARLEAMTAEEIEQNAIDDPDNPPSTDEELERGVAGRFVRQTREATGLAKRSLPRPMASMLRACAIGSRGGTCPIVFPCPSCG